MAGTCFQAMHTRVNPRRWWDGRSDRLPPWAAAETAEPGPWAKPPPAASGKVRVCDRARCSVPAETLPSGARGSGRLSCPKPRSQEQPGGFRGDERGRCQWTCNRGAGDGNRAEARNLHGAHETIFIFSIFLDRVNFAGEDGLSSFEN